MSHPHKFLTDVTIENSSGVLMKKKNHSMNNGLKSFIFYYSETFVLTVNILISDYIDDDDYMEYRKVYIKKKRVSGVV